MDAYYVTLTFHVSHREDGSVVATCNELPIILAAGSLARLQCKAKSVEESVSKFLSTMTAEEQRAFWKSRGLDQEAVEDAADQLSIPVLVSA